jgi:hypothetical protein
MFSLPKEKTNCITGIKNQWGDEMAILCLPQNPFNQYFQAYFLFLCCWSTLKKQVIVSYQIASHDSIGCVAFSNVNAYRFAEVQITDFCFI